MIETGKLQSHQASIHNSIQNCWMQLTPLIILVDVLGTAGSCSPTVDVKWTSEKI